jgi:putative nucleotidyltransferase with HDIG domain
MWYAGGLAMSVAATATLLLHGHARLEGPLWVIAALCAVGVLAERQSVYITSYAQVSVSVLPILFAAAVYGPLAAMVVGASAMLADFGRPYTRWVVWTASRALVGAITGVVAVIAIPNDPSFTRLLAGVAIAAIAEVVSDVSLASITAILRGRAYPETIRMMVQVAWATVPLYTPTIAVLAYAYAALSPWTVLLFFVPAVAAQRMFVLYQQQRRLADDLAAANARLGSANLSFATALVAALDARDQYTAGHSAAVAVYARDIAARLELSEEEQELAHLAGLVHDIGKVGLPPGLLEKPGALTLDERRQMEEHSIIGERILSKVSDYLEIARIVRHHHERIDGNGYPDGLKQGEIPLISKIIAVADAYNAMTSERPYREAMPSRVARMRLAQAVGSQFDTTVAAAFEAILATASEGYLAGASADFAIEAQRHTTLVEPAMPELIASYAT